MNWDYAGKLQKAQMDVAELAGDPQLPACETGGVDARSDEPARDQVKTCRKAERAVAGALQERPGGGAVGVADAAHETRLVGVEHRVAALGGGELPLPLGVVAQQLVGLEAELEAALDDREPHHQAGGEAAEALVVARS